ncbi:unnamed protein product [Rotaria magnacalcarata]|uniref:Peptidase S1 domain-containing protein n=1 Tax=Rotaria magnacalcarata TaxID=392030 RepID=A0A820BPM0_9BILA|nr:unnamed protein product [Rotaria magnacalcarata]CAF4204902.1 unnamed protein product [Rotaria magnacalcarata]
MQAEIKVFNPSQCNYRNFVSARQICAGGSSEVARGICNGDSGDALLKQVHGKWVIFGVTSFGPAARCAHSTTADGFTRVKYYKSWINERLKHS